MEQIFGQRPNGLSDDDGSIGKRPRDGRPRAARTTCVRAVRLRSGGSAGRAWAARVDRRQNCIHRSRGGRSRAAQRTRCSVVAARRWKPATRRDAKAGATPGTGQAIPRNRRASRARRERRSAAPAGSSPRRLRCRCSKRLPGHIPCGCAQPGAYRRPAAEFRHHPRAKTVGGERTSGRCVVGVW